MAWPEDPQVSYVPISEASAGLRAHAEMALAKARRHDAVQAVLAHPAVAGVRDRGVDPVVLAAVAGLLLILLVFACRPGSRKTTRKGTPTAVLVGPSDAGKTALFLHLAQDAVPPTRTSATGARASVALTDTGAGRRKILTLLDMPGHARLRDAVPSAIAGADAAVFVVDVTTVVRNAGSVAEHLPPLLTAMAGAASRRPFNAPPLRLLVLAHKADLLTKGGTSDVVPTDIPASARATAIERVRSVLTREMERLKAARSAGVGGRIEGMSRVATRKGFFARLFGSSAAEPEADTAEDDEAAVWGGNGPWSWNDIDGVEVVFGASALGPARDPKGPSPPAGDGLDELNDFLWDL